MSVGVTPERIAKIVRRWSDQRLLREYKTARQYPGGAWAAATIAEVARRGANARLRQEAAETSNNGAQ